MGDAPQPPPRQGRRRRGRGGRGRQDYPEPRQEPHVDANVDRARPIGRPEQHRGLPDRGRGQRADGPNPGPFIHNARRGQGQHRSPGPQRGFRGDQRGPKRRHSGEEVKGSGGRLTLPDDGNRRQCDRNGEAQQEVVIGYRKLEELASLDGVKIMEKLSDSRTLSGFAQLTSKQKLPVDWIRLVVTILAKLCKIEYKPIVVSVFHRVCEKEFMDQLLLHIVTMNTDSSRKQSCSVGEFYKNLCTLCDGILNLLPALACDKLENLIKKASSELDELTDSFDGREDVRKELELIKKKLKFEMERVSCMSSSKRPEGMRQPVYYQNPPNAFRDLTVFPTVDDILVPHRPYLRPSIVDGPYESVDHYLDIQFRLLREDFVRPLREGVQEYLKKLLEFGKGPSKKIKVNNVRVYEKVQFVKVKTDEDRIGLVLCFDPEKKFCKTVKWEYSKRLMNKSLLVLTRDASFSSVTLVTVSKQDPKELQEGRVLVELCEGVVFKELFRGHFLMIECQVFFGAYCHVLEALQSLDENSFPLKEYLIEASKEQVLPDYVQRAVRLNPSSVFLLPLPSDDPASHTEFPVQVDDVSTWPVPGALGLDESQFNALRGAVTSKVMLIQGPPGTGKTFLGLKVAKALLMNKELWTSQVDPRPMLVVCYTNHALDQFLLGLMNATDSIVRVGGGCKEPQLGPFSINMLRRNRLKGEHALYKMINEHRQRFSKLRMIHDQIHSCSYLLKEDGGIVSPATFRAYGIITEEEYKDFREVSFLKWLLGYFDEELFRTKENGAKQFMETILDLSKCSFDSLEDTTDFADAKEILFCLSCGKLKEYADLMEKGSDQARYDSINRVLNDVKKELQNPATQPQNFQWRYRGRRFNLWLLAYIQRWQMYRSWKDELVGVLEALAAQVEPAYSEAARLLQESRMVEDQAIMANNLIIGMTTSYAASRQRILKQLKPRIVIVEEAAEVLEAHVLVALAGAVEHLILIGDHQQLRPNPAVYELARKYHLDVSMFERLIRNGVHCVSLSTQHRMRPEVARLICPAIYPNLLNHESVTRFPPVRGVTKNVFFLDHTHPEEVMTDALSFQNCHEGNFLSSFVRYLMLQGYDASKITILSTYKGQQFFFSKLRHTNNHLKEVRMTVVDNFQGEENDIILLSLVRSNNSAAVGFLKTENRVNVALSRARHGLFIIGNMSNMTAEDTVWRQVKEQLERDNSIGRSLSLRCDIHGTVTAVSSAKDFEKCPNGGCLLQCGVLLPSCGHICSQVCHTRDREHKEFRCYEPCMKEICPKQHMCPDRCYEQCRPCKVPKTEKLPCCHMATMPCHQDPKTHKCQTKVPCVLPACGHTRDAKCYETNDKNSILCETPCPVRMNCGHSCGKKCHVLDDPEHVEYKCMKPCGWKKNGCRMDHLCEKMCHEPHEDCNILIEKTLPCRHKMKMMCKEDPAVQACKKNCKRTLACGHKCHKVCYQVCEPCETKVEKVVPRCGHTQRMECGLDPASFTKCDGLCQRPLACGHRCQQECRHPCSSFPCTELVPFIGVTGCGHKIMVPCNKRSSYDSLSEELLQFCKEPCKKTLECGHLCSGTCGSCHQGRFHVACQTKCDRVLICGHQCKEPCAASCPPCGLRCTVQCAHTKCFRRCGVPCVPCKEKCKRQCAHRTCLKLCGDLCPQPPCDQPCRKKVEACGHDCIGLCGDPCLCRPCNEDKIDIFFGTEDDEDARFTFLPDCQHVFESSGLDRWVLGSDEDAGDTEINKKVCPQCKTPISTCERYSNIVKQTAIDVAKVKAKLYGNWKTIEPVAKQTRQLLDARPALTGFVKAKALEAKISGILKTVEDSNSHNKPTRGARKAPPLSLAEVQNLQQYVNILSSLWEIVNKAYEPEKKLSLEKRKQVLQFVESLCTKLSERNLIRLSSQEASDVNMELERLQHLAQLCQVECSPSFNYVLGVDKVDYASVSKIVRGLFPYESEMQNQWVKKKLIDLAKKASVSITEEEIRSVVAALGMVPGRWFMCPNGHPYCITECGGAMEEGTCNDCGARIGGTNHRLRSDNRFAPHIDGASAPLYPTALMHY